ncbi:GyrI-like domain-containing protein [Chitinivorax sp. B]|uniref:AraC family transcriptional regulator n=1 Tax=Chitinivorax sp. B TaxID=2502235 RepID=UPI002016DC41|nr:GyrI-like domain-containing protein [Chitinivorax sp. B]
MQRLNRVLDFIDQHLGESLELVQLADIAHFSPFHFHRLFTAIMGETLGDYIRRRRLAVAAFLLASQPQRPVLEIALSIGFGSGEALARAFKLQFGSTPTDWRQSTPERWASEMAKVKQSEWGLRNLDQVVRKANQAMQTELQDDGDSEKRFRRISMNVTIQTMPERRVAYMRHIGPYGSSITDFWEKSFEPWLSAAGLTNATCYGVGHDDPSLTPPEKCRYDACVEIPDDFVPTGQASTTVLAGGRYAVMRFRGTGNEIGEAWTTLFRDWLPSSGMQVQCDVGPCFERYEPSSMYDSTTGQFECDLCVPVRPL